MMIEMEIPNISSMVMDQVLEQIFGVTILIMSNGTCLPILLQKP